MHERLVGDEFPVRGNNSPTVVEEFPARADDTPALVQRRLRFGLRPGLERIRRLLDALASPERAYPVIHVAGTNGKGSTAVFIAAILGAAGYRVGLYASPHLTSYRERIVVDGLPIGTEQLAQLVARLEPVVRAVEDDDGALTEFEVGTALAFTHFRDARVDVAVVEVGLGGRLDATNVVEPALTVITPIALDHTQILGSTLPQVAAEKAGIVKPGIPLVLGPQQPAAAHVVGEVAQRIGAPVWPVGEAPGSFISLQSVQVALEGTSFQFRTRDPKGKGSAQIDTFAVGGLTAERLAAELGAGPLHVALIGRQQALNAATACTAALALVDAGWELDREAVVQGLAAARWPGRTEPVERDPLVILDGAHNMASMDALTANLSALACPEPLVLVFGTLQGKPAKNMLMSLAPMCRHTILTSVQGRIPGRDPKQLAATVQGNWAGSLQVEPEPARALAAAREVAGPRGTVLVAGSLYLIGELRGHWAFPPLFKRLRRIVAAGGGAGGSRDEDIPAGIV